MFKKDDLIIFKYKNNDIKGKIKNTLGIYYVIKLETAYVFKYYKEKDFPAIIDIPNIVQILKNDNRLKRKFNIMELL